jgi:ribose 5-phosphate isomerase B
MVPFPFETQGRPFMSAQTVAVAADHAGFSLKEQVRALLEARGLQVIDLGPYNTDSVDYPRYADAVAAALSEGRAARGVLVCGTGLGISIAANRHTHVRAALCHEPLSAQMAREHNDANVLVLGGRMIGAGMAEACLDAFLNTPFAGGRHERRVAMLSRSPISAG